MSYDQGVPDQQRQNEETKAPPRPHEQPEGVISALHDDDAFGELFGGIDEPTLDHPFFNQELLLQHLRRRDS